MDFTSDNRYLIYDAFNNIQLENETGFGTWSIYGIDLETGQTYALTKPVSNLSMGYPVLSQTTNHLITFDILNNDTGYSTVFAANLITGDRSPVVTVPGWGIPVYNGDDTGIVYSSPDSSPTGFSLMQQPLDQDLITPIGNPSKPFDLLNGGIYGVIFRRGTYTPPEQDISVSASTMDFGEVSLGDAVNASVTISNDGTANLQIDDLYLTGVDSSDFSIVRSLCVGGTLVPSGSCVVTVAYSPTSEGEKSATLSINSDDPDTPVFDVLVYGEGIDDPLPAPENPGWVKARGLVTNSDGTPLCVMILANGQHMFTCDPDNKGGYDLEVPLDQNGEILLYAFCSGMAPYAAILTPEQALNFDITLTSAPLLSPEMTVTVQSEPGTVNPNWIRISGTVTYNDTPLCVMVLANGQHMFTCSDPVGSYDMEVPLDGNGEILLYVFCSGMLPFQYQFIP
jgi:hypothetical protein